MHRIMVSALLLVLLVLPGSAHAHRPVFLPEEPAGRAPEVRLGDGTTSWVVYGAVAKPGTERTASFQLREGDDLLIQLLVPDAAPESARRLDALPTVELTHHGTVERLEPARLGDSFFEPFSAARYRMLLEHRRSGVDGGTYVVRIDAARPARFALVVGQVERFGPGDVVTLPSVLGRAQAWYRGDPGDAMDTRWQALWMAAAWLLVAGVPLLTLLLIIRWVRRRARRR